MEGESSNDESLSEKKKPSSEEMTLKKEESSKELVKPEKSDEDEAGNDDKNCNFTFYLFITLHYIFKMYMKHQLT